MLTIIVWLFLHFFFFFIFFLSFQSFSSFLKRTICDTWESHEENFKFQSWLLTNRETLWISNLQKHHKTLLNFESSFLPQMVPRIFFVLFSVWIIGRTIRAPVFTRTHICSICQDSMCVLWYKFSINRLNHRKREHLTANTLSSALPEGILLMNDVLLVGYM